jgi:hypothetical protein
MAQWLRPAGSYRLKTSRSAWEIAPRWFTRGWFTPSMTMPFLLGVCIIILAAVQFQGATLPPADAMTVRHPEGLVHGFLVLRRLDGTIAANGESIQVAHGGDISTRLVFHFKDGSLQDEVTVFSQSGHFHLVSDHLIQKGPTFKRPIDMSIDGASGMVTANYQDEKGKDKTESEHFDLPADLVNGLVPIILKNVPSGVPAFSASMIVASPKPLLVKLAFSDEGQDSFGTGSINHKADRYVVKVEIGGVKGVVAPLVGKQPADTRVWIVGEPCPAFVKSEGPMAEGGPILRTELVSPTWHENSAAPAKAR